MQSACSEFRNLKYSIASPTD